MSSVVVTIVNEYMPIGVEKGRVVKSPKRETEFGMPCICASYIYINYGNYIHESRSKLYFTSHFFEGKGKERNLQAKGPPECANYYNHIDANFQA